MTILQSIKEIAQIKGPVVLAMGVFDGVHKGHQAVLGAALAEAQRTGATPVVFTFNPHPVRVLRPADAPRLLCSLNHELLLLGREGFETVLLCPFNAEIAALTADEFIGQVAAACHKLSAIVVGTDWRFGRARSGSVETLQTLAATLDFTVIPVPVRTAETEQISSTLIRKAVAEGQLAKASDMLGRDYSVYGKVIQGKQLARKLGFPTANLAVENEQLPPAGVYVARVYRAENWLPAVANLGHRPTVTPDNEELSLEVHLLDFDGDLYGQALEVAFVTKLRDEQRFSGLEALSARICKDAQAARACLNA